MTLKGIMFAAALVLGLGVGSGVASAAYCDDGSCRAECFAERADCIASGQPAAVCLRELQACRRGCGPFCIQ